MSHSTILDCGCVIYGDGRPRAWCPTCANDRPPATANAAKGDLTFEHVGLLMDDARRAVDPRRRAMLQEIAAFISHSTPAGRADGGSDG